MYEITLDKIPVSLNNLLRMHWQIRKKEQMEWEYLLLPYWKIRNEIEGQKIRLTVIVHRKKLQDEDNAVGSLKCLIDALKNMDFLVDDNHEWLELQSQQMPTIKGEEKTILKMEVK